PDADQALEQAVELGCARILTSGCALKATAGLDTLKRISAKAAGRITLLPGSGIRPANVGEILEATGSRKVHGSCSSPVES
ncbi:copper homeostasis protein CutC, partial [Rhizobium ruizarguesonis]